MECRDLAMAAAVARAKSRTEVDVNTEAISKALDDGIDELSKRYYAATEQP